MAPRPQESKPQVTFKAKMDELARQGEVDAHLAAKVSQQLVASVAKFKTKLHSLTFGVQMDKYLTWIPECFILQQLPQEIRSFRSYLCRFHRGSSNSVLAFVKWVEWAEYENGRGTYGPPKHSTKHAAAPDADEDVPADEEPAEGERKRKRTAAREHLNQTAKSREHVRALLQMCVRHNSTRRKEGVHALIHHFKDLCAELSWNCRSYEELQSLCDPTVAYGLVRLVLGMVSENFFRAVMHAAALSELLRAVHSLNGAIVLSVLQHEMALTERMKAFLAHQARRSKSAEGDDEDELDPDKTSDATKAERNQRLAATILTLVALLSAGQSIRPAEAKEMVKILCFCYVEHRGLRVLSANVLLSILRQFPQFVSDDDTWLWLQTAFLRFHRLDYTRPEGIQLLLFVSTLPASAPRPTRGVVGELAEWLRFDPLQPTVMEKLGIALFRREHVTECHPAVHPVWEDYFQIISDRCAAGESAKVHLTNMVHNLIAPYRRGAADIPRAALFRQLLQRIAHLALMTADEGDRAAVVHEASKTVGLGKAGRVMQPTEAAVLRRMKASELTTKVDGLIRQYRGVRDKDPEAKSVRLWAIRELRGCLAVEHFPNVEAPYVNAAVRFFFREGLCNNTNTRDAASMNRCIYAFAEAFSFTYVSKHSNKARPVHTVPLVELLDEYLRAEKQQRTRYFTATAVDEFREARALVEDVLRHPAERTVLLYDNKDILTLLFLVFVALSIDDPSSDEAKDRASTVVPDLVRFYRKGTLDMLPVLYDLMTALCAATNSPLQVMPLMSIVRRLAIAHMVRLARFIKTRVPLDMLLAPLVEAFHTDEREALRLAMAEGSEEDSDADADDGPADRKKRRPDGDPEAADAQTASGSSDSDDDDDDSDSDDEEDGEEDEENDGDSSAATEVDGDENDAASQESSDAEGADEDEDTPPEADDQAAEEFLEEEPVTQEYVNALKSMVKDRTELDHVYPTQQADKEKTDVLIFIRTALRVGLDLRSPIVVHVFQVLLAVLRNTMRSPDPVVFDTVAASLKALFRSEHRFFGYFCSPQSLYQILGDIQSYLHKTERAILQRALEKRRPLAIHGGLVKRRMGLVKSLALSTIHYIGFLAEKNSASPETRSTVAEYWKTLFCERGWDSARLMPHIKQDLYHFRHGFAWIFVPAALQKALSLKDVEDPTSRKARVLIGTWALIEAFLPRLSGLPAKLKSEVCGEIRSFFEALPLKLLFDCQHTMLFHYFHCLRMSMEYNSKLQLNVEWVTSVVREATEDDTIQLTRASIRQLSMLEKLLSLPQRVANIKPATPFGVLHKQHATTWRKKKSRFYKKARKVRHQTLTTILAAREEEPTEVQKEEKRERRSELRRRDLNERRLLKEEWLQTLTKEEKDARRAGFKKVKQDRIAINKARKAKISAKRKSEFEEWREKKLQAAEAAE